MLKPIVAILAIVTIVGPQRGALGGGSHVLNGPPTGGHYVLHAVPFLAQREDAGSPRSRAPLTILQINDVYSTLPIDEAGGLARVATLRQQLAAAGRTPVLVLAGDFLSTSVASSVFQGEQMIAALNAAGLDMATLGNHEFDLASAC